MKKLFLLAITMCFCLATFAKVVDPTTQAKYLIRGYCEKTLDKNGKAMYTLNDVTSHGFDFEQENDGRWIGSYNAERGDVEFRFQKATTTHPAGLKNSVLDFWTYDAEINEWQHDVEVRQGTSQTYLTKQMIIMLVLDYSESVGEAGAQEIKESARLFINSLYQASSSGNVQIGIIKFNTKAYVEKNTFAIRPLTEKTYYQMMNFIEDQRIDKGTALYYSIDKAIDMIENYPIPANQYAGSYMLIFTDGLDNVSTNDAKGLITPELYYDYVTPLLKNTIINGQGIDAHLVALKGNDITTDAQYNKFRTKMKALCNEDNYHEIQRFQQLREMFGTFADNLVNSWTSLVCYIPEGRVGQVCWTLGEVNYVNDKDKTPKVKTPTGQKQLFLGVNLGGGAGLQNSFGGYWAIGADFAYPITQKFGLGAYLTFGQALYSHSYSEKSPIFTTTYNSYTRRYEERLSGYNTTYYSSLGSGFHMTGGVQATIGDYSSNRACIVGLGGGLDGDASMADFRVGGIWKNGFYFFGNLDLGSGKNGFAFNMGFHFGYNFGRFIKCK